MVPAKSPAATKQKPRATSSADLKQLLSRREAAEMIKKSPSTLQWMADTKKGPPCEMLGGRWVYRRADLVAYLKEQKDKIPDLDEDEPSGGGRLAALERLNRVRQTGSGTEEGANSMAELTRAIESLTDAVQRLTRKLDGG